MLLLLTALLLGAPPATSSRAVSAQRALDELRATSRAPGIAAAVVAGGRVVFSGTTGLADLERQVPMTARTKLGLGSVTKSLTTAAFARLVAAEPDRVSWDSPVERWLPGFRFAGRGLTPRLVAGHLSGLGDGADDRLYTTSLRFTTAQALEELLRDPLAHAPGQRHLYGTATYTVLAAVVEAVRGRPFPEALRELVLDPLELRQTVPNDRRAIVPDRTSFYVRDEATGRSVNAPFADPSYKLAGAGYLASAEDAARFGAGLLSPRFLPDAARAELFRTLKTEAGEETGFALGWRSGRDSRGRAMVHQPGGGLGISSWVRLYPDRGVSIAVLSNETGALANDALLDTLADLFLSP